MLNALARHLERKCHVRQTSSPTIDNEYRGYKVALWLFGFVVGVRQAAYPASQFSPADIPLALRRHHRKPEEEKSCRQSDEGNDEKDAGFPLECFVFSSSFGLKRSGLKGFSAMWT
jgi:hypothetical protein